MQRSSPRALLIGTCLLSLSASAAKSAQAEGQGRPQVALETMSRRAEGYVAALKEGGAAELTLQPALQEAAERMLEENEVPFGAAVAVSIPDGRVLALAGRSKADPSVGLEALTLRPWAPAASVFKVVAAAALVEEAGLDASARVCYHGGVSSLLQDNLVDLPRIDRRCDTLAFAVGKSQNAIIAKLAARHLDPEALTRIADGFGWNAPIPFDVPVVPSYFQAPESPLEFARAAAGFWHSSLSALHGALVAATVANGGTMPTPRLIEKAIGPDGKLVTIERPHLRRVLSPETAREVGQMMTMTTRMGTARHAFQDRRGQPLLPVDVAGKTGTLFYRGLPGDPALPAAWPEGVHLGYSWFVGFAPADKPRVAFAVVLGNDARWRIRAAGVAKTIVAEHLGVGRGAGVVTAAPARPAAPPIQLASAADVRGRGRPAGGLRVSSAGPRPVAGAARPVAAAARPTITAARRVVAASRPVTAAAPRALGPGRRAVAPVLAKAAAGRPGALRPARAPVRLVQTPRKPPRATR